MRFGDRVVAVTGGGSGIGRAAVDRFAAEGARVAILDIDPAGAKAAADAIGVDALAIECDVTDLDAVTRAFTLVDQRWSRLDVLFNNAGVDVRGTVADTTEDAWRRCFELNVTSTFLCSRAAVPLLSRQGGAIVNQASVAGLVGIPNLAPYCAAKGAVIALTRSMAVDLAPMGIRVNVLCPGTTLTPLAIEFMRTRGGGDLDAGMAATLAKYPLGRLGTPEEIAAAALFLASDDASFLTGVTLAADGGMTAQ
jgi:NAD(P)-dependent dehydrogenase (short-subunit alcohol dehydrogenase family)